jgi:carbon-monoxide dehydrogenase medium subunit
MYEFTYHRPSTVREGADLLIKNEDAKLIAGGHTLVPVMKQRLAAPAHVIDLSHVEGKSAARRNIDRAIQVRSHFTSFSAHEVCP